MADIATLKASVAALSDSPSFVERAAHALFVHDGDGVDDWAERTDAFKDIYREEIQLVLQVMGAELAEIDRALAA